MVRPVREDLYISVPSFFRCPISLDVMKSPVSLCTGVTYDRSSIQRWLDSGNNTCPATMQVLHTKDFVPNRTLQRLIQIWSQSSASSSSSVHHQQEEDHHSPLDPAPNSVVPSRDEITRIVMDLDSLSSPNGVLSQLVRFARESEDNREFLAKMDALVPMLVDFLGTLVVVDNANAASCKGCIDVIEDAVRVLDMIFTKIGGQKERLETILLTWKKQKTTKNDKEKEKDGRNSNINNNDDVNDDRRDCLSALLLVLQQGSGDARIGSVRILESIAFDAEWKFLIAENEELLRELVKSIALESDPSLIQASLTCLIAISKAKRVRVKLVHLKTVPELRNLLTWSDATVSMTEKSLKLLETVSSCKEGREEMCGDPACVEAVVNKLLKVSGEATEHATTVLWSVCYLFRDQRAQEAVTRSNGLTKILLLMQSNCSPAVRQMSADVLKIFRVNSKSCLSSYDTKTTHIMPF